MSRSITKYVYTMHPPSVLDHGGYLERKDGELCLRRADAVMYQAGRWRVKRSWIRPSRGRQFDTEIYNVKGKQ